MGYVEKMTGFKKKIPPSLKEFNELKILNKFTGLDYEQINKWFNKNKDAVLVVDKISNVKNLVDRLKLIKRE